MSTDAKLITTEEAEYSATNTPEKNDVVFHKYTENQLAWMDIKDGFQKWRIWLMFAYHDVKLRYRRSILGPFWLTLSMAITVYSMGFLYAKLFHVELEIYYPFLVAGMLSWSLISTLIIEYTDGFASSEGFIKQLKLPYSLYIHRIVCRNIIIFFHNILVIIPVIAIFHTYAKFNWNTLLLIPGLLVIYINALTYGTICAMLGARYRDVSQVIKSLVQVVFFITPVMWVPTNISEKHRYILDFNPFYALTEFLRAPLLGHTPTSTNLIAGTTVTVAGILISLKFFTRYRMRIVYWL